MSIIVTGAAGGIGRRTTAVLLERGYRVIAVDRRLSDADRALETVEGDVNDQDVIDRACAAAGTVTGVVACAGISRPGSSDQYSAADWSDMVNTNLTAVFELMRTAARCAGPGASFIGISSVTAAQGFAGRAAYAASKAGVEGMVRALAVEYAPRIRVNAIAPGFVFTEMTQENVRKGVIDEPGILARTPMARWGDPTDIANAVAFLLGPESAWITGITLPVDGGWGIYGLGAEA